MQNDGDTQDTPVSWPEEVILVGALHVCPFHARARPRMSSAMQNDGDAQDTAWIKSVLDSSRLAAEVHELPFQVAESNFPTAIPAAMQKVPDVQDTRRRPKLKRLLSALQELPFQVAKCSPEPLLIPTAAAQNEADGHATLSRVEEACGKPATVVGVLQELPFQVTEVPEKLYARQNDDDAHETP